MRCGLMTVTPGARALRCSIAATATDSVLLFYKSEFAEALNAAEVAGVLAYEVMHPALQRHTRHGDRDVRRWKHHRSLS